MSSSAASVFSNVGSAGLLAIAAISLRACFMAAWRAGLKSATLTLSNVGTPPYGPAHRVTSGSWGWALGAGVSCMELGPSWAVVVAHAADTRTTAPALAMRSLRIESDLQGL